MCVFNHKQCINKQIKIKYQKCEHKRVIYGQEKHACTISLRQT